MPPALTNSSTIQCSHAGTVQKSSSAKLKVNGSPVLLQSSLGSIPDCPNQSQSTTKDSSVSSVTGGVAQKLKAGGNGVLLASLAGQGNGTPPGTLSATANQSKLIGT